MINWQCHSPSPYNTVLFDAVAKHHPLHVHYRYGSSAGHPWKPHGGGHRATHWNGDSVLIAKSMRAFASPTTRLAIFGSWVGAPVLACMGAALAGGRRLAIWTDTPDERTRRNPLKALVRTMVCRGIFARAHRVLGTGPMCLETLASMGCAKAKLVELPYIVEPADYQQAPPPSCDRPLQMCIVGRLSPEKGVDTALKALAMVRQSGASVQLSVIGSGPDEGLLRSQAEQLGLNDHVRFLGWLQREELRSSLSKHHFLVHAARHEPYGVVVVEALCSGLPVIGTSSTAAVAHRVRHGINGFVCEPSAEGLAAAMRLAVDATPTWRDLSNAALIESRAWPPSRAIDIIRDLLA